MKDSAKDILKRHMEEGFVLSKGAARSLTSRESSARRLNEIIQDDKSKYSYFMAEPQNKDSAPYKVFFKSIGRLVKVEKTLNSTFILVGKANMFFNVRSREFNSRKSALASIKSCTL